MSSSLNHAGDRPIEITLQRAWQALTWPQRLRLLGLLLRSGSVDTSELNMTAVEALKDNDVITSVVAECSQKFPQVRQSRLFLRIIAWGDTMRTLVLTGTGGHINVQEVFTRLVSQERRGEGHCLLCRSSGHCFMKGICIWRGP